MILLFAETSEARNPRRKELIAKVLDDLAGDLAETLEFDPDRAVEWIQEWEALYDLIRSL